MLRCRLRPPPPLFFEGARSNYIFFLFSFTLLFFFFFFFFFLFLFFFLCPLATPLLFSRFEFDIVSRVTLPAWPEQGYGRHWLFFRALSPVCILSVVGRSIIFFVYYICILDSWSRVVYIFVLWVPSRTVV